MKSTLITRALAVFALLFAACASTGGGNGEGVSLLEAVEQSADKIAAELPKGSRVAIVAFESENDNLSDFIMQEITGALVDRGIEVADRQNLAYVYKELNFQMSGDVSDETAQSVGKFLGAQLVITGQLTGMGASYRYRASAIHVEKASPGSVTRLTVRKDRETRDMIAAIAKQKASVKTAGYGATETAAPKTAGYGATETAAPKTAGAFLDRGIAYASRGEYEKAIADFTEAIKLDPKLSAAYSLRGRARYAGASEVYSVDANFGSVGTISTSGKATANQARAFEQAIADFTAALRLDPNNANNYHERGMAYSDKGDHDRAIADFNQVIRLYPNFAGAYSNRGLTYQNKGDYDRAIADFNQAIRLNPNDAVTYSNRGNVYGIKGDYDRAIADFNQAIRLNPNFDYGKRAFAYFLKKDYDRAIADFNQAIRLNPNYAAAYSCRGIAYYMKKDYDRAIADFNQAIRLDPNDVAAYINRGNVYKDKGDYDRAIADYGQVIRLNPNYAAAYSYRGEAYSMKKDYDRAIADFNQAIRLDPNIVHAYVSRGFAYGFKGDYNRAIADFNQAIRLDPNDAAVYNIRGLMYGKKGDYDQAIADFNQAIRLNPNYADAKQNLERARKARGR